jgi:hypothetical protein
MIPGRAAVTADACPNIHSSRHIAVITTATFLANLADLVTAFRRVIQSLSAGDAEVLAHIGAAHKAACIDPQTAAV